MKTTYLQLTLLSVIALFSSCDEALPDGVNIPIPASSSVSFDLQATVVNEDADNIISASKTVDISNLEDESGGEIESIKLDKLVYEVSGYSNTSGNLVLADMTIRTSKNGSSTDILVITGLVVENTGEVLAFEDGNPSSALSAAQVASLESIMESVEPFDLVIDADFTEEIDGNLQVKLAWDITASVKQSL